MREATGEPTGSGGLALRMVVASVLLALLVGAAFAVLLLAISDLRTSQRQVVRSREANAAAARLEERVIDLETGVRGFVIARQERFLEPWRAARAAIPGEAAALARLVEASVQQRRVQEISDDINSYIRDYSVPLVTDARRGDPAVRSVAVTAEGKRRVDALRLEFETFRSFERELLTRRQRGDDTNASRAVAAAVVGLAGSIALIFFFAAYLTRAIVQPIRRASRLAEELAAGDLTTRMPEKSVAEIGALERSFNRMAAALEEDRDDLRRLADEQAALRRVATLVARGVSPEEMFEAVTREVGLLSGADVARMERYEADGTVTGIAGWSKHEAELAVGTRIALEGVSIAALVRQTEGPVRVDSFDDASGPIAEEARAVGIRSSVGCPIVVGGGLWGVIAASAQTDVPFPPETESQMGEFTELVATAIANAENEAELRASRARIVAASDLTRRQIERDLHDGVQQRLVSLALGLRTATSGIPPRARPGREGARSGRVRPHRRARRSARDLARDSPGDPGRRRPRAGVETLARRSRVPVELDVRIDGRLAGQVEVTAYYVVSEALTNTAKHAHASVVQVASEVLDGKLVVEVRDDGVGGAEPVRGSGLVGLRDRAESIGGTIVSSGVL